MARESVDTPKHYQLKRSLRFWRGYPGLYLGKKLLGAGGGYMLFL